MCQKQSLYAPQEVNEWRVCHWQKEGRRYDLLFDDGFHTLIGES